MVEDDEMSGEERIEINPATRPKTGWYLTVEGPDANGFVSVDKCIAYPKTIGGSVQQIQMHTRDWCALFDWWACNIWGMEGDEDGESTAETDQPSPPQEEG